MPSQSRLSPCQLSQRESVNTCSPSPFGGGGSPQGLTERVFSYGLKPRPPSKVRVSPVIYLKSGWEIWTQTLPISASGSPK